MKHRFSKVRRREMLFQFFIFGIVLNGVEDILAVYFTTGQTVTSNMIFIVILLAIPFALVSEWIADHVDFVKIYRRFFGHPKSKVK